MVFVFVTVFRKENEKKTDENNCEPINTSYKADPLIRDNHIDQIKDQNSKSKELNELELEEKKKNLKLKKEKKNFIKRVCIYSVFLSLLVIASISNKDSNSFSYQMMIERNFGPELTQVYYIKNMWMFKDYRTGLDHFSNFKFLLYTKNFKFESYIF